MRQCHPAPRAIAVVYGVRGITLRYLHRHRAIVRQVLGPVHVAGLQRAFDEQAAETGAVDVEIGLQAVSLFEDDLIDEAVGALRDAASPSVPGARRRACSA